MIPFSLVSAGNGMKVQGNALMCKQLEKNRNAVENLASPCMKRLSWLTVVRFS